MERFANSIKEHKLITIIISLLIIVFTTLAIIFIPILTRCEHEFSEKITIEPTCKNMGVKTVYCKNCDFEEIENIPRLKTHEFSQSVKKKPTCKDEGIRLFVCQICGLKKEEPIDKLTEHTYKSKILQKANCISNGIIEYTCTVCKYSYTEEIPQSDHNWKEATCVKARYCTVCKETEGKPLGHSYENGECILCGKAKPKDNIDNTSHYHSYIRGKCSSCGDYLYDLEEIYEEHCSPSWATLSNYYTLTVDTNPYDWNNYLHYEVLNGIKEIHRELELPAELFEKMIDTAESDGVICETHGYINVTWYFSENTGLEITYTIN